MANGIYTGVGGVRREVPELHTGVGGAKHSVKEGYAGVGGARRLFYRRGVPASSLEVGSTVKIELDGTPWEWLVVHQGNPDATIYDTSCDGTWLLLQDIYTKMQWHSSLSNDYEKSGVHDYLNGEFLQKLSPSMQNTVRQVIIPYRKGEGNSTTASYGTDGLSCKVFLLSCLETGVSPSATFPKKEGACLKYFEGISDLVWSDKRIANFNGAPDEWHIRSPYCKGEYPSRDYYYVAHISSAGNYFSNEATYIAGVRPALIMPGNARLVKA